MGESLSGEERTVPRVVLFRPSPIDRDTRAKKIALTLARGGYDVVVLTPVVPGESTDERRLGPVRVCESPYGRVFAPATKDGVAVTR